MDVVEASRLVSEVDDRENSDRGARLVELNSLLGDRHVGFHGQAAEWLFDDVKATWIYGYFTATVLASSAFCIHQLAGLIRLTTAGTPLALADPNSSLEGLAALAEQGGIIDDEVHARLLLLDDVTLIYSTASVSEFKSDLDQRMADSERFAGEHGLLADARDALTCAISVLDQGLHL